MLQEKLKHDTLLQHERLESLMFVDNIMGKTLNPDQYKKILLTNYIAHKAYEEAIFGAIGPDLAARLDLNARRKLAALERDVEEAGLDEQLFKAELIVKGLKPLHFNEAAALGALYVMEGATLGGSVILKQLKLNPSFAGKGLNFYYYGVYGGALMANWKSFVDVLNAFPEGNEDEVVEGAKQMFDAISAIAEIAYI
ncbi:biliverdin-producing heme oxygenase [Pedobacter faecalis]|uniref:biliverdin-producing heme oxygenase n=1 Tax=Pedobacter faecalis TaxID=3041495 RepID=UPI00254AA929|nr:biliverdin-producing heme oxygenase [Pedobacter sp. ELA7]